MFARVPDLLGSLLLNSEGAILSSEGELENAEETAKLFTTIVGLTDRLSSDDDSYKKLSITFSDCSYVVCLSNRQLHIVKLRYSPPPPPARVEQPLENAVDA